MLSIFRPCSLKLSTQSGFPPFVYSVIFADLCKTFHTECLSPLCSVIFAPLLHTKCPLYYMQSVLFTTYKTFSLLHTKRSLYYIQSVLFTTYKVSSLLHTKCPSLVHMLSSFPLLTKWMYYIQSVFRPSTCSAISSSLTDFTTYRVSLALSHAL